MPRPRPYYRIALLSPIFSAATIVRVVADLNYTTLQRWVNRGLVVVHQDTFAHQRKTSRRLYSAANALQVATMRYLTHGFNVPLEVAADFGEIVIGRALAKTHQVSPFWEREGFGLYIWTEGNGQWQSLPFWADGLDDHKRLETQFRPPAFICLAVDPLIYHVIRTLIATIEDTARQRGWNPSLAELLTAMRPLFQSANSSQGDAGPRGGFSLNLHS